MIIEVETDAGLVGLGEAPSVKLAPAIEAAGAAPDRRDPLDIAEIESLCLPAWCRSCKTPMTNRQRVFGSLEIALWDLRGKAQTSRCTSCWAARCAKKSRSPNTSASRWFRDGPRQELSPESVAEYCLRMREQYGSTLFEGKLIQGDAELGDPHGVRCARRLARPRHAAARLEHAVVAWRRAPHPARDRAV